jgi:hypothetical protein
MTKKNNKGYGEAGNFNTIKNILNSLSRIGKFLRTGGPGSVAIYFIRCLGS